MNNIDNFKNLSKKDLFDKCKKYKLKVSNNCNKNYIIELLCNYITKIEIDNVETNNVITNNVETNNVITNNVETNNVITNNVETNNVITNNVEINNEITNNVETNNICINEKINNLFENNYYVGDNIDLLKNLKNNSINIVYFDPPYNSGRDFYDFNDKYDSKEKYINFIRIRIDECYRILKNDGTLVIHIEPRISHYFRMICDDIFGENNFRNEIVWISGGNSKNKYKLNRFHDTIIVYSKTKNQIFNPLYFEYDNEYKKKSNVKICKIYNKEYVTTSIYNCQPDVNPRLNLRYEWNGHNKQWYVTKEKMQKLHDENRLEYNKNGLPRIKRFLDEMDGIPLRDVWYDIKNIQSYEKLDYATQKPIKLLERIIKLYSNKNDLCLDIFAGSGTLGRACISCERNYLLFDINYKGKEQFLKSINNI
jgi:DNA modification methylase